MTKTTASGPLKRGRPTGSTSFEAAPAKAFGTVVRATREADGIAQEELALLAAIERAHLGRIERGERLPSLALVLRIARALNRTAGELVLETEALLAANGKA